MHISFNKISAIWVGLHCIGKNFYNCDQGKMKSVHRYRELPKFTDHIDDVIGTPFMHVYEEAIMT